MPFVAKMLDYYDFITHPNFRSIASLPQDLAQEPLGVFPQVVFVEQYYNSPWFTESSRQLSERFIADWNAMYEEGKRQFILKDAPIPLLVASFMGSVRETANLVRSGGLDGTDATFEQAFAICWDGLKA